MRENKECSICGGTILGHECQSICTKCYNDFFYSNYPHESGIGGEHYNNYMKEKKEVDNNGPTDI